MADFGQTQTEICVNDCVVFSNNSQFEDNVTWLFDGGNPSQSISTDAVTVCYAQPGVFSVGLVASNSAGNDELVISDAVTVHAPPSASLLPSGDSLLLETDGTESSINWFLNGLQVSQNEHVFSPVEPGNYEVTLQNDFGCTTLLTIEVDDDSTQEEHEVPQEQETTGPQGEEWPIFIPNAITMDENGINDAWITYGDKANWVEFKAQIFNRWGDVVFETHDPFEYWIGDVDGGGHYIQDGVYNYLVRVRLSAESIAKQFRGHVVVIR